MVTDDILCAVRSVIDRFETEAEKNAGQAVWDMLSDFSEDEWEEMDDQQKSEWIGKYISKTVKQKGKPNMEN